MPLLWFSLFRVLGGQSAARRRWDDSCILASRWRHSRISSGCLLPGARLAGQSIEFPLTRDSARQHSRRFCHASARSRKLPRCVLCCAQLRHRHKLGGLRARHQVCHPPLCGRRWLPLGLIHHGQSVSPPLIGETATADRAAAAKHLHAAVTAPGDALASLLLPWRMMASCPSSRHCASCPCRAVRSPRLARPSTGIGARLAAPMGEKDQADPRRDRVAAVNAK